MRLLCRIGVSLLLLSSCALSAPAQPDRTVRVWLLADPKLIEKDPRWSETAAGLLRAASDFFEREFKIRFVAQAIGPWSLEEGSPSTAFLLKHLMEKYPPRDQDGGYDLVIGLTGERVNRYFGGIARVDRIGSCREGLGNYLVSAVTAPYRYTGPNPEPPLDVISLIHEFGHIFGAEHVNDSASIMHENFDYRAAFDARSREIILMNKFCPFGR